MVATDLERLQKTLEGLAVRHGQRARYFACDLTEDANVRQLVEELSGLHFDAIINNAGIQGPIGPLHSNDWQEWKDTIQVNLLAPVLLCKSLLPQLLAQGTDVSIINLSGGGATGPRANFTAYATAKTGLVRFSETLAEELKDTRLRVNCIAPGAMQTDMLRTVIDAGSAISGEKEFSAAERAFSANDSTFSKVAALCHYLISERSRDISGKLISAVWDPFDDFTAALKSSDIGTLRRIVPEDRGVTWGEFNQPAKVAKLRH